METLLQELHLQLLQDQRLYRYNSPALRTALATEQ
jgi:hypothetical protein